MLKPDNPAPSGSGNSQSGHSSNSQSDSAALTQPSSITRRQPQSLSPGADEQRKADVGVTPPAFTQVPRTHHTDVFVDRAPEVTFLAPPDNNLSVPNPLVSSKDVSVTACACNASNIPLENLRLPGSADSSARPPITVPQSGACTSDSSESGMATDAAHASFGEGSPRGGAGTSGDPAVPEKAVRHQKAEGLRRLRSVTEGSVDSPVKEKLQASDSVPARSDAHSRTADDTHTAFTFSTSLLRSRDASFPTSTPRAEERNGSMTVKTVFTASETGPYESENVRKMKRTNYLVTFFIVLFAVAVALAGGLSVGFVNKHFAEETSRKAQQTKNRIVLNSSLLSLHTSQDVLTEEGANLITFLNSYTESSNYSTPKELRDILFDDFMRSWRIWLSNAVQVDSYAMYVPFCNESQVGKRGCSTMALLVSCSSFTTKQHCYYGRNSDDGQKIMLYNMPSDRIPSNGGDTLRALIDIEYAFFPNQTGNRPYFLMPTTQVSYDGSNHTALTLRTQSRLNNGQLAVCNTVSYIESWFDSFSQSLQSADDSYSVLFSSESTILSCQVGKNARLQQDCYGSNKKNCDCSSDSVIRQMVSTFIASMPQHVLTDDVSGNGDFIMSKTVANNAAAYQDFLRFRTEFDDPNLVYFAAYATPINNSIGTEGVVQIVVCVVVIVLCVLILGCVAAMAVAQMQKVIMLVSRLATHASMYDTESMELVLLRNMNKKSFRCWDKVIPSSMINEEFHRILENLKAYRPFLPPSLLDQGHSPSEDETVISFAHANSPVGLGRGLLMSSVAAMQDARTDGNGCAQPHDAHARGSHHSRYHGSELQAAVGEKTVDGEATGKHSPSRQISRDGENGSAHDSPSAGIVATHGTSHTGETLPGRFDGMPLVNDRLRKGNMRCVKGTVMVVQLAGVSCDAKDADTVINFFVECVATNAKAFHGVVDVMDAFTIVVSFNCHFTVLRHQEKACRCAVSIRDDFARSLYKITIGIASGPLYVGTIGTETQRARVVAGEGVWLAKNLVTLRRVLSTTIMVTDEVSHESGSVTCVQVDTIRLYKESTNSWAQYGVSEVVDTVNGELPSVYSLAKKIFRLVRGRHLDAARTAVDAVAKLADQRHEALAWPLQRLRALVHNSPRLIKEGYHRTFVVWDMPEGSDLMSTHVHTTVHEEECIRMDRNVLSCSDRPYSLKEGNSGVIVDETKRAAEMINEQQQGSMTRRRVCAENPVFNEEETLFPVFLPPADDEEDEEFVSPTQRGNGSTPSASPPPQPNAVKDIGTIVYRGNADGAALGSEASGVESQQAVSVRLGDPVELPVVKSENSGAYTKPAAFSVGASVGSQVVVNASSNGALSASGRAMVSESIKSINGQLFYRTNTLLGRGAFGEVYLGIADSGGFVAIKMFPADGTNTVTLIHEVETLSRLRNDHIVAYDCCAVQQGRFFIMSEYMAAGSVKSLIKTMGAIPLSAVRKYGRDILFGLAYLHGQNWLHCDIKPDNILLTPEGACKIADFGAAELERSVGTTGVRGTPRFMAPEAVLGHWTTAADVFSFGITLALMVTGRQPWPTYTEPDHLFLARYVGEVQYAKEKNVPLEMRPNLEMPDVEDRELVAVIQRCCAAEAAERPTVEELLDMLS